MNTSSARDRDKNNPYCGFEQGPIRPPSEARSLLVRVTRNCSWNRCVFCPVYKTESFSVRPAAHIKSDIDLIYKHIETIKQLVGEANRITPEAVQRAGECVEPDEWEAFRAAANWVIAGEMKSVFLQDADSIVIKPAELIDVLGHLRKRFPSIERITSYSRSRTIVRRTDADLRAIKEAGLNRIHIGLESGSDQVLAMVDKGSAKAMQIDAGLRVKRAGMELSEYVMPGLGGQALSMTHALETADALNRIDPDFIRIRTLAIPQSVPLFEKWQNGEFKKCSDLMVAHELLAFIEHLNGISSVVASDHVLNLFMDLEGRLPDDKDRMLGLLRTFHAMDPDEQRLYQVGRRAGVLHHLEDLKNPRMREAAERAYQRLGVTPENVDKITDRLMMRFV